MKSSFPVRANEQSRDVDGRESEVQRVDYMMILKYELARHTDQPIRVRESYPMKGIPTGPPGQINLRLTDAQVHDMAVAGLNKHIEIKGNGEQSSPEKVWEVLVSASANGTSIEHECQNSDQAPSPNTVRGALEDSLELKQVEDGVNQVLLEHLDKRYWNKPQNIAVDLHEKPYHGKPQKDADEIRGGKAKSGTSHFHVYATAYVTRDGRRVTLALVYVRAGQSASDVLDALEARLREAGLRVNRWLADRGFCEVEALHWFAQRSLAIVPLTVRGNTDPPSASRTLKALKHSQWRRHSMTSKSGKQIEFDVAVVRRRRERSRKGKFLGSRTLLYCVVGQKAREAVTRMCPEAVADLYRSRFGVESSYRQLGQGCMRTSTRSPMVRLLAVGISLVLRNLWILCQWLATAHRGPGRRSLVSKLSLATVLWWIGQVARCNLEYRKEILLEASSALRF